MPAPKNTFKAALAAGETQIGCWISSGNMITTELMGTIGFDWLLVDGEHAVYDLAAIRQQVVALEASASHTAVRVPIGETWIIKQVLDLGVQTVLVPMVESAEQARELVRACRYPPTGARGVGYSVARTSRYAEIADYGLNADQEICLLVQVENRAGLAALDDILQIDGIDGVFIGPADLSADMGKMGQIMDDEIQALIYDTLQRIAASGKAPGILSTREDMTQKSLDAGARFVATGVDLLLLRAGAVSLRDRWMG